MSEKTKLNKSDFFYYHDLRIFLRQVLLVGAMILKIEKELMYPSRIDPERGPPILPFLKMVSSAVLYLL